MIKFIIRLILLYVLFMVAVGAWLAKERTTDWDKPLNIVVYSINGDDSIVSQKYIDSLQSSDFNNIESFFEREAKRHNLALRRPVDVSLAGELEAKAPAPPQNGSILSIMMWSLKLRYWAWQNDDYPYLQDIQIFVQYFDPEKHPAVAHSLGLQKGLIGVVNAFASKNMKRDNNVVIAHELLHTVGAVDKYDPETNQPIYPSGYGEPEKNPLFPQYKAEIMAGRIAVSESKARQPKNFKELVLGKDTAIEINWIKSF